MAAIILFGIFFLLLFMNMPIAFALGISSLAVILFEGLPLMPIASNLYAATSKFVLLAIPFFILGGNVMDKSGISSQLIDFARTLVGHRRSGMALVTVIVACFFAAISGSGPATVAALGMILIPAMTNVGYQKNDSAALVSTAGAIGIIIPPSITFVIYGSVTGESVGELGLQQEMAKKQSLIMDGRDIGTVVIPDAELKIFLTASNESRAKRRLILHLRSLALCLREGFVLPGSYVAFPFGHMATSL